MVQVGRSGCFFFPLPTLFFFFFHFLWFFVELWWAVRVANIEKVFKTHKFGESPNVRCEHFFNVGNAYCPPQFNEKPQKLKKKEGSAEEKKARNLEVRRRVGQGLGVLGLGVLGLGMGSWAWGSWGSWL